MYGTDDPIADLTERLACAALELHRMIENHRGHADASRLERARLEGKMEGIKLAMDYLRVYQ